MAERGTEHARLAAEQARTDAEESRRVARAQEALLRAQYDEIERTLEEVGPAQQQPTYEEMRVDILGAQSSLMVTFLRNSRLKDGTTMLDRFEQHAEIEFKKHQRFHSGALGTYRGESFKKWKERTVAAQAEITRALAR